MAIMSSMKQCAKCKISREGVDFTPSQLALKSSRCRECVSTANKEWKKNNIEKVADYNQKWYQENRDSSLTKSRDWHQENREKALVSSKNWHQENKERANMASKKWRQENPEKVILSNKEYSQLNSAQINTRRRSRYQNDPVYRNRCIAAAMAGKMLRSQGVSKNGESSSDYFPWTPEELWEHLLECMKQPNNEWMNKDNQGPYDPETWDDNDTRTWTWQLDHIIPQSDLPYDSMEHPNFKKSWSLSNLRPLSAKQNIIDGTSRIRHKKKIPNQ
jgi:hypothetical protein